MKTVTIQRVVTCTKRGTIGEVRVDGVYFGMSVERPWIPGDEPGGAPNVSCIPRGRYTLSPYESPRFGKVRIIEGDHVGRAPGEKERYGCLFHAGNSVKDVTGCVAVGRFATLQGDDWRVVSSRKALRDFFDALGEYPAVLVVT